MCGIAGGFGRHTSSETVRCLTDAIAHRGPDASGIWENADSGVVLGHRRLSIVDLSPAGAQPMESWSGRFVTVFNGEIYNYRALRAELEAGGARFRGHSDTEVMLAAFEKFGVADTLGHIDGMFATAVFDCELREFWLFRDRLGLKPLYYTWNDGTLYFSSEMSAPFARLTGRVIDRRALALYMRYNYIPAPLTIYEGAKKLNPGTMLRATMDEASRHQASISRYFSVSERVAQTKSRPPATRTLQESIDLVEHTLSRSVAERMVADVPVGAFLSGGIDSSLVVAHMQEQSATPVRTFTIGFDDPERNEAHFARAIAHHLGTQHTEFVLSDEDAIQTVELLPRMYGEPFADSSQIPTYLVSRETRGAVTVALSGDGADELFGGYSSYRRLAEAANRARWIPALAYAAMAQLLRPHILQKALRSRLGDQRYDWAFNAVRLFSDKYDRSIPVGLHSHYSMAEQLVRGIEPGDSIQAYCRIVGSIPEQMMAHDTCIYLPDDILTKVDRASMAVSLEVRAPFADDSRLFDAAWSIPLSHKINETGGKVVLKAALARHMPPELFDRPKMGFAIPLGKWLNGPLKPWVDACTDPSRIAREGYLSPDVVSSLVQAARSGDEWYSYKLWAVCIFQSWLDTVHSNA